MAMPRVPWLAKQGEAAAAGGGDAAQPPTGAVRQVTPLPIIAASLCCPVMMLVARLLISQPSSFMLPMSEVRVIPPVLGRRWASTRCKVVRFLRFDLPPSVGICINSVGEMESSNPCSEGKQAPRGGSARSQAQPSRGASHRWRLGWWRQHLALKLADLSRARVSARAGERVSRASPPPLSLSSLLTRADVPGVGGSALSVL